MGQDDGTTIYLLRHGESHANVRSVLSNGYAYDAGLTGRGRRQSVEAAGWLQGSRWLRCTPVPCGAPRDRRHREHGARLRGYGLR